MAETYVLFQDVLKELGMTEAQLKKLVEDGKIRHFMDSGKVKFRRKDVDELKASLGIAEKSPEEEEISLAPPDELPEAPTAEEPEAPPPPPPTETEEEAELLIEPLDENIPTAAPIEGMAGEEELTAAPEEEEIGSLSAFEIGEGVEEEGEELSEEEAQLLSVEAPGFRALEEPQTASVGMTVVLVIAIVFIAVGAVSLFSFIGGYNPFPFLTDLFVKK
jgi:hypothetical protein